MAVALGQVPALPESFVPTLMAVQALALVLTFVAPQVRSVRGAQKAIGNLQAASAHALGECQILIDSLQQTKEYIEGFAENVDVENNQSRQIAEARTRLYAFRGTLTRAVSAIDAAGRALTAARKYDSVLRSRREWRPAADQFETVLATFDEDIKKARIVEIVDEMLQRLDALFAMAHDLTAAGHLPLYEESPDAAAEASNEYNMWLSSLPDDDFSDIVDVDNATSLRWVEGSGWVEGKPA